MKVFPRIVILLALMISVMGVQGASAQGGLDYAGAYQIVNLTSDVEGADVTVTFYNPDGSEAGSFDDNIAANSSKTYFMVLAPVGSDFAGSMVISSTKLITAISNLETSDNKYAASTTAFSGGNQTFYLPLIMCNNNNYNTFFSIQNVGLDVANVTINYVRGVAGVSGSEPATIPLYASKQFDQAVGSATKNCSSLGEGTANRFLGSAKITSDQPVVATVMQLNVNPQVPKVLMGYNGFPAPGNTTIQLPLVMGNNSGFYTVLQIQNVGTNPVAQTVTIDYGPNTVGTFNPVNETCSLAANQSCTKYNQNTGQWTPPTGKKYIGNATITSSEPLVAIVNQNSPLVASSYEGFGPSAASEKVILPLIMANESSYYTVIQVANVGAACNGIVIDYGPNTTGTFNPVNEGFNLVAGGSRTIYNAATTAGGNNSNNNWGTSNPANRYRGSAVVTGPSGCQLLALVNEQRAGATWDTYMTYVGYNTSP